MATERLANRWVIAVAAVVTQLCLGAVYGWSVFVKPLIAAEHWTLTQVSLTFTLSIVCVGFGTVVGGLWQDRVGPRKVLTVAGFLYGAGYMLAALGAAHHSLGGIYLGYGLLAGFGMGMGYIVPVATMVKWFPDRRGLMTGVAVCGYGAGALVMSPPAAHEIVAFGVPATFFTLGVLYMFFVMLSAQFYGAPPPGWRPEGWEPRTAVAKAATTHDFSVREAMRTTQFWLLLAMLFLNVSAGIMIISQASPMAQQLVGLTPVAAAGIVGIISIFNGLGRLFWAAVSDALGRARVFFLLFLVQAAIFFALPHLHTALLFTTAVSIVGLCYGGGFGTMPSFTADFFGSKNVGGIYGWILWAWALGAVPSPILIARVRQTTGGYGPAINVIAIAMVCALVLPLLARRPRHEEPGKPKMEMPAPRKAA
jgi:OFA family oxalate/formate antiporter-like MFS transporter